MLGQKFIMPFCHQFPVSYEEKQTLLMFSPNHSTVYWTPFFIATASHTVKILQQWTLLPRSHYTKQTTPQWQEIRSRPQNEFCGRLL